MYIKFTVCMSSMHGKTAKAIELNLNIGIAHALVPSAPVKF